MLGGAQGRLLQLSAMKTFAFTRGFTLIELLIAVSIFAFLIMIGGPQYANFIGNMQIRNGAENTLTGVRLAQAEAIRGNSQAQFVLDPTPCTGGWRVNRLNDETGTFDLVQSYSYAEGACKATATATPGGATTVTFNGLGRVVPNADASASISQIDVTNSYVSASDRRPLRVAITAFANAGVKLCDPDPGVASDDPRVCPS